MKKIAWRAASGFCHDRDTLIVDVVYHEENVLGNNLNLDIDVFLDTWHLPAKRCLWVASSKKLAARYGDPEQIDVTDALVLGNDGEGGFLVVLPEGQGCQF